MKRHPLPPRAEVRWPPSTTSSTGSSTRPTPAIEPSTTRVPLPSAGEMKPSPQGRLPKAPLLGQLARVGDRLAARELQPEVGAVRVGDAGLRSARRAPPPRRAPCAAAPPCRRSSRGRACSSVAPGIVAPRAPASVARLRAAVWERDWTVGAISTSAAAIASATVLGGSAACEARSEITVRTASAPGVRRLLAQALAEVLGRRIADDQGLLPLLDAEAIAHHRPHRSIEIVHRSSTLDDRPTRRYDFPPAGVAQSVRAAES